MTLKIMAWEMVEANELTRELEAVREQSILEFFKLFFVTEENTQTLQSAIMLTGAAVSYLLIRSDHIDVYGGVALSSEEDWEGIASGIDTIIRGILSLS